jgi:hypothetical protein
MRKNDKKWLFLLLGMSLIFIFTTSCRKEDKNTNNNTNPPTGAVTDVDGNVYHAITIGTQTWLVENLKVTKFNDFSTIPLVSDGKSWGNPTPGYCWYNNADPKDMNDYGCLYNWYAVNTGKLAPIGWHVPTEGEWLTL